MILTIIVFIVILSILVLVHEAGHYFVAKLFGIRVEEFGLGLPPRAKTLFTKNGTIYSLNWLPIGGFVKLYGEDDAGAGRVTSTKQQTPSSKKDVDQAFFARPVWQRASVVVAGVVMNFLLAVVIFSFLAATQGISTETGKVVIAGVASGSPAQHAGLTKGDTVLALNGKKVASSEDLVLTTHEHVGDKLSLQIKKPNGQVATVVVTPRVHYPANQGPMGVEIAPQQVKVTKYPWYQAPIVGFTQTLSTVGLIIGGFVAVIAQLFSHGSVPEGTLSGPVGIAQATGQFVQLGFFAVLSWAALLSVNLAILNILPFPALDGGRFFFILIEGITRKKVNPKFEEKAHVIGMAILIALILLVTLHDILRLATGQPVLPQ